ncbi:MAG: S-layer homology domain-containing protein, partial [Cyanobacteria bacterium J06607_10]
AVTAGDYTDIGKAPEEIQSYLVDLLEMDLLEVRPPVTPTPAPTPAPTSSSSDEDTDEEGSADGDAAAEAPAPQPAVAPPGPDEFRPNQAITRREYARWLLAVNNRFYLGERDRKIRPGVTSSQPVFSDVPVSDPDFADIQGLAEAGIIPSPLTGSSTNVTFRPNAPLTRKDMVLWKVPLDTRQALPAATVTDVQQVWGFQDAAKIEPRALQAVLADHQNGDFANFRRAYSYTTLFQPDKAATRAEAAAVLWRFGNPAEGITAQELRGTRQNDG